MAFFARDLNVTTTKIIIMIGKWLTFLNYANLSVQYTAIFHGCKKGNFQMKKM